MTNKNIVVIKAESSLLVVPNTLFVCMCLFGKFQNKESPSPKCFSKIQWNEMQSTDEYSIVIKQHVLIFLNITTALLCHYSRLIIRDVLCGIEYLRTHNLSISFVQSPVAKQTIEETPLFL